MNFFRRKHNNHKEHEEVQDELDRHEDEIGKMQTRLREVEMRVGIYKPPVLQKVEGGNDT